MVDYIPDEQLSPDFLAGPVPKESSMKFSGGALESCRNTQLPRFCFMLEGPDTAVLFISLRFQPLGAVAMQ